MTEVVRVQRLARPVEDRKGQSDLPLLSVSATKGVVPRSTLTSDQPRAEDLTNYRVCRAGDLVINRMSAYQGALGHARQDGIVSPDYLVLRPNSRLDVTYAEYLMKTPWFVSQMASRVRGIGSAELGTVRTPRINWFDLGQIEVALPDAPQQRRIAEFLDRETAQIDELIAKQELLISTLAERRMSLVVRSVTRGLDPHALLRDTGARWIGSTPTHWLTPRLGHLLQVRNGADCKDVQADDGDYPVFGSGGEFARANAYLHDGEALLLGRKGTIDRPLIASGRFWTVDTMFYAVPIAEVDLQYLYFAALCFPYGELSTVTALPSMTSTALKAIRVPRPPLDEQRAISAFLCDATSRIDLLQERAESAIALLRERRQALISAAVTGKIDVGGAS